MSDQKEFSINEFLRNPEENSSWCFNFYDWFCSDSSLLSKAKQHASKLKFLVGQGVLNGDKCYAWFKNNCPGCGNLYDDIRISIMPNECSDDNDFLGGFCPKSGHHSAELKAEVWLLHNTDPKNTLRICSDAEMELVQSHRMKYYKFPTWADMKKEIKENEEFRKELKEHFDRW